MKIIEAQETDKGEIVIKLVISKEDHIILKSGGYESDRLYSTIVSKVMEALYPFEKPSPEEAPERVGK
jgi:hypothetical protein